MGSVPSGSREVKASYADLKMAKSMGSVARLQNLLGQLLTIEPGGAMVVAAPCHRTRRCAHEVMGVAAVLFLARSSDGGGLLWPHSLGVDWEGRGAHGRWGGIKGEGTEREGSKR